MNQPRPLRPALVKQYSNQPSTTLAVVESEDPYLKSVTETKIGRKTEKSVHFAAEEVESVSDADSLTDSLHTSHDVISWLPSEHLYKDNTFISESQQDAQTEGKGSEEVTSSGQTYGTNTFMDLESEDETRTASEFSQSEGLSSSEVFSSVSNETYREWKDVTEIVKDIEELEESEFVTKADTTLLEEKDLREEEDTDVTDSLEAEMAREDFVLAQIRRLKLGAVSSPHSLAVESPSSYTYADRFPVSPKLKGADEKARAAFCKKAILQCQRGDDDSKQRLVQESELHKKAKSKLNHDVAFFGLNPTLVDRLRIENLQSKLKKKMKNLDKDAEQSEKFVRDHQHIEEEFARQTFIEQSLGQIQKDNTEERIQAHLFRMHPVQWFSDFVRELPKASEDSWDILYRYKTTLEKRRDPENS